MRGHLRAPRPRVTCAESTHPAGMAEPQARTRNPNSHAHSACGALRRSVTGLEQPNCEQDLESKVGQPIIDAGACPNQYLEQRRNSCSTAFRLTPPQVPSGSRRLSDEEGGLAAQVRVDAPGFRGLLAVGGHGSTTRASLAPGRLARAHGTRPPTLFALIRTATRVPLPASAAPPARF